MCPYATAVGPRRDPGPLPFPLPRMTSASLNSMAASRASTYVNPATISRFGPPLVSGRPGLHSRPAATLVLKFTNAQSVACRTL